MTGAGASPGGRPPCGLGAPGPGSGAGAISLHTRSSVFESLWWVAHGAHPAVDI